MKDDSSDHPVHPRKGKRGSASDMPPQDAAADIDPATTTAEEDGRGTLPDISEPAEAIAEGGLTVGHAAIENAVRLAPTSPGVYRMLNAANDVLACRQGQERQKATDLVCAGQCAAAGAHPAHDRGHHQYRDRLDRDRDRSAAAGSQPDHSCARASMCSSATTSRSPYPDIRRSLGAADFETPRRADPPRPLFRSVRVCRRGQPTITALQRAFLIRSCTDSFFESRTCPCLLYQIRRCAGPCTREIDFPGYTELVRGDRIPVRP